MASDEIKNALHELEKINIAWRSQQYRRGDVIRQLVDAAIEGEGDEADFRMVRGQIAQERDEHLKCGNPLLEPYRMSLLIRRKPRLDDWSDDPAELEQETFAAVEQELRAIAEQATLPLRVQLLFDSYERIVRDLNRRLLSEQRVAQAYQKLIREEQEHTEK